MSLATCTDPIFLDPHARGVHEEGRRLNARGPLVEAELQGGLRVWATGRRDIAEAILGGDAFRKDPEHWADLQHGRVPADWGILELITLPGMLNMDGARHRELRSLVNRAFTPRRIEALRPHITEIVQQLLDDLADASSDFVDLRRDFAFQVPMQIVCHLFGLDPAASQKLAQDYTAIHSSRSSAEQIAAGKAGVMATIAQLVADKRARPGDDLTSALIKVTDGDDAVLDDGLLVATLMLFLFAGHETTQNALTNAIKALTSHQQILDRVQAGAIPIEQVIEETLRWNSPIHTIMFRYAAEDVLVPGTDVTVQKGEAVVLCIAAAGRDPESFGPDVDTFDPERSVLAQHLAFGYGAHFCIGAPLARMMSGIALGALVDRFTLDRAGAPEAGPIGSYSSNSDTALWTRVTSRRPETASAR